MGVPAMMDVSRGGGVSVEVMEELSTIDDD